MNCQYICYSEEQVNNLLIDISTIFFNDIVIGHKFISNFVEILCYMIVFQKLTFLHFCNFQKCLQNNCIKFLTLKMTSYLKKV